jgi:hypothetical protein
METVREKEYSGALHLRRVFLGFFYQYSRP